MTAIGWQQMWNEGETNIFTNVRTNVSEWWCPWRRKFKKYNFGLAAGTKFPK